jgi:hypothetical protein
MFAVVFTHTTVVIARIAALAFVEALTGVYRRALVKRAGALIMRRAFVVLARVVAVARKKITVVVCGARVARAVKDRRAIIVRLARVGVAVEI